MPSLLRNAAFAAYVSAIFLNAFVDLGHKIVIQNTLFKIYEGETQIMLTAIVNALILLPFVMLFTPAGYLSDKYPKNKVMKISAWLAVGLTSLITLSYYNGWFWTAFSMTFLLALQSAILSPAKYGYIRELLGSEQLARANGIVQATTTTAILGGIFFFSILFENQLKGQEYQTSDEVLAFMSPLGWWLIAGSLMEVWMTSRLPTCRKQDRTLSFDWHGYIRFHTLHKNLSEALERRAIRLSIIGLSIFWAICQVILAVFPAHAKAALAIENTVVIQGLLASSGIGIILGSLLTSRLSRNYIETGLIPFGAMGITLSLMLIPELNAVWLHALNFILFGVCGGMLIVPLNALIQFHAQENQLGKVLAASNLIQNIFMLSFLALTVFAAYRAIEPFWMIALLSVIALAGSIYTLYRLPQSMLRLMVNRLISTHYHLEVHNLHNLPNSGGVLMLGNHISWLDWAMIQMASPRPVRFVMDRTIYSRWYLKRLLDLFGIIPISPGASRTALGKVQEALNNGEVVCLFPEGSISRSGQLGEFHKGYTQAVKEADAVIIPFYLRGLWGSFFSRAGTRLRTNRSRGILRNVIVAFGEPLSCEASPPEVKQAVHELSISAWQAHAEDLPTLPEAWMDTSSRLGRKTAIIESSGQSLSYNRFATLVIQLSQHVRRHCPEQNIGIILPSSTAGALTNMAVLTAGKTVVNINFTSSNEAMAAAGRKAEIKSLYTSRKFIERLSRKGITPLDALGSDLKVYYLEDEIRNLDKKLSLLIWLLVCTLPAALLKVLFIHRKEVEDTAAILFSSGSEGEPKGIELSHTNIVGNLTQVADMLDTQSEDRIMATLPLFHAFGLTVTTFLPLVEGIPLICHPDPTDALNISRAIARYQATILCGTCTFLRLYTRNRRIHPLMLDSLRIVVSGAERLNPEVRDTFSLKFNKQIMEGYGTTETTPVASVNLPDRLDTSCWEIQVGNRPGTVGMPLPGSSFRIVDPETLATLPTGQDGLIIIGGVQVMKGYLNDPERTAESIVEIDGQRWYKTGDKGHLDDDGFLTIVDRYSRFAKIGGEMISLSVVQEQAQQAIDDEEAQLAAVAVPSDKKGEQIILLTTANITTDNLRDRLIRDKRNALTIPAEVRQVEEIPLLGSGKVDYKQAKELAMKS